MSILSNLLEYSSFQSTSLAFCPSPQSANMPSLELTKQSTNQSDTSLGEKKRPASKSLSKLTFFSSIPKIDPKERILHRLVYKLSMKCRKHYYTFFVMLQHLKKKNIWIKEEVQHHKLKDKVEPFVQKVQRVSRGLYSKHYEQNNIKVSFDTLKHSAKGLKTVRIIKKLSNKLKLQHSFQMIQDYCKSKEKEVMRMQILCGSISQIIYKIGVHNQSTQQRAAFLEIRNHMQVPSELERSRELTAPCKRFKRSTTNDSTVSHEPGSPERLMKSQKYQNLVSSRKRRERSSSGRVVDKIILSFQADLLRPSKRPLTYMKTAKVDSTVLEEHLKADHHNDAKYKVCSRCEPDVIRLNEVPDLHDRSNLFFEELLGEIPSEVGLRCLQIDESQVEQIKNQPITPSESQSILNLMEPLNTSRQTSISTTSRCSFGSDAVSFKNSLVQQREAMKGSRQSSEPTSPKKQYNFNKVKDNAKKELRAHDSFDAEPVLMIKDESVRYSLTKKKSIDCPFEKDLKPDTHSIRENSFSSRYAVPQSDKNPGEKTQRESRKNLSLTARYLVTTPNFTGGMPPHRRQYIRLSTTNRH